MAVTTGDESALSQSNTERRVQALRRKIARQGSWRLRVWAQCEQRIRNMQNELEKLGVDPVDLEYVDFPAMTDDEVNRMAADDDDPGV